MNDKFAYLSNCDKNLSLYKNIKSNFFFKIFVIKIIKT